MPLIKRLLQRDTGSGIRPDLVDSNAPLPSSLPESAFLDILSALKPLPDFPQLLATVNEQGQTLLHLAVHLRYRELVQKLIHWGIDPNIRDVTGSTALHAAYLCDDPLVIGVLKTGGATPFILDELGRSPTEFMAAIPGTSGRGDPLAVREPSMDLLEERCRPPHPLIPLVTQDTLVKSMVRETRSSETHSGLSEAHKPIWGSSPQVRPPRRGQVQKERPAVEFKPDLKQLQHRYKERGVEVQADPPPPYASSPPSINSPRNLQVQSSEARRERPVHDASNSATDRRATRYSRYPHRPMKRPAVSFEPDVEKLQDRCRLAGADEQVVLLIGRIFSRGVTLSSLMGMMTAKELASYGFGSESGQAYVCFLRADRDARYRCRLCPRDTEMSWKHQRDVLRHLRRDHFGLAEECHIWCVSSQ